MLVKSSIVCFWDTKMKSFQQVVAALRSRHTLLISAEKEAFLKALFQVFSRNEEINLQKHLNFAFDDRQCSAIITEFKKRRSSQQSSSKADPKEQSESLKRKYSQLQQTPKKKKQPPSEPNSPARLPKTKQQAKTESIDKSQEPSLSYLKQQRVKCKFFPFCDRADSCQFYHPAVKCNYFPKCREGSACMYMHEPCRYDEKCTRVDCAFDHRYKPKHIDAVNVLFKASRLFLSRKWTGLTDSFEDYSD